MTWGDIHEEVLELFTEAQSLHRIGIDSPCPAAREWLLVNTGRVAMKRAKNARQAAKSPRREYHAKWQTENDLLAIRRRLAAGERPKRWGKKWRAAADMVGLSAEYLAEDEKQRARHAANERARRARQSGMTKRAA